MNKLKFIKKKKSGRDVSGKVVVRHQGGEHKRFMRVIDFKRRKTITGRVVSIEYDPNRTSEIALVQYADGEKKYILAPLGLNIGAVVKSGENAEIQAGNALPLRALPVGTFVHNVELTAGRGGQLIRGAGGRALVLAKDGEFVDLKLPSGELRRISGSCFATVGTLGNENLKNEKLGKAGRSIHMGIRPTVRGVSQNPRSHPHGGGEGRSGIGMPTPKTYAGRPAVGKTRKKKKYSDKFILQRRRK